MKIRLTSDLHLEFLPAHEIANEIKRLVNNAIPELPEDKDTILVIAGDLCSMHKKDRFKIFFDIVSPRFKKIFYVAGNHEYYGGTLEGTRDFLFELTFPYRNIEFYTMGMDSFDGKTFSYATMWTDYDGENPETMKAAMESMNDYFHIKKADDKYINPEDVLKMHKDARKLLDEHVHKNSIVITHHLPSFKSVDPAFKKSRINGAYASNLDGFILDKKPSLWLHGHTHFAQDYKIGDTRIVCNPRGYKGQEKNKYNPTLILEV